ncbi:MAG: hypothetical protein K2H70_04485 [Bacteroidales bacterium]|nr:hypothetical protein [Bacteroidales bacterium]
MKLRNIVCLLAFGLICGLGMAQGSDRARSGFQGLWQERSGHSLHLTYGFFVDSWFIKYAKTCLPIRFDLDYQYDIPWKFKRANFFAEAGLGYLWVNVEEVGDIYYDVEHSVYHRASGRFGAGLKVHCTDWLYLSFGGGFNLGGLCEYWYWDDGSHPGGAYDQLLWGGYSSAGIVGQIERFSISLGYRADHWHDGDGMWRGYNYDYGTWDTRDKTTNWFITLGLGYHF